MSFWEGWRDRGSKNGWDFVSALSSVHVCTIMRECAIVA